MGAGDVTGVDVDNLHSAGRTIAGRAEGGRAAARNISSGLDSASSGVGHSIVKGALSQYVTNHIVDDSNLLGNQLQNGGDNVANVASTARASDEEAAHSLQTDITTNTGISDRINRQM